MKKDYRLYLSDILYAIERVQKYTKSIKKSQFEDDEFLQDAVMRRLSIIGEAANRLSGEFIKKHPEIPWKEIIGTRNIIIHYYEGVKLETIWKIIRKDLTVLKKFIKNLPGMSEFLKDLK